MKWESDQKLGEGVIGWVPPKRKGESEQPRWTQRVDINEAMADSHVAAILERWWDARLHEAPAYGGGVLDSWPALMADGLALCRIEETAIDDFRRWKERPDG